MPALNTFQTKINLRHSHNRKFKIMLRSISIFCCFVAATSIGFSSCKDSKPADDTSIIGSNDTLPDPIKRLVKAVADNDAKSFAGLVSYPLERPYPLRDIVDSIRMTEYYSTLVDDSLKQLITTSKPDDWSEFGWRGWTVGDGQYLWIDDNLYAVNYLSAKEAKELDKLIDQEINSLPENMRQGWKPVVALSEETGNGLYRIDYRQGPADSEIYRLAVYDSVAVNQAMPVMLLTGHKETEGTASVSTYIFTDDDGDEAVFEPEPTDSDTRQMTITQNGRSRTFTVKKVYWRDYLAK